MQVLIPATQKARIHAFKKAVWENYRVAGRHNLPWRKTHDPYRILVSEIMLQQTQVSRVEKFYKIFIKKFLNFRALAKAPVSSVLRAWQGMGYNRRALALHRLAHIVVAEHGGRLPRSREELVALPGVGNYTAGAIRTFAWNEPEIFVETNIRRAFIHHFFPRAKKVTDADLARYLKQTLRNEKNPRTWYWALMDYGAALGVRSAIRPSHGRGRRHGRGHGRRQKFTNPNRRSAHYAVQPRFTGSARELRGMILRTALHENKISLAALSKESGRSHKMVEDITKSLINEGFFNKKLIRR